MNKKVKILIMFAVVLVVSVPTAWYFLRPQPVVVLTLKYYSPLFIFSLPVNSMLSQKILPEPLEPSIYPTLPNITLLRIRFASGEIYTTKGSATTFLVFLTGDIDGTGVSQATGGKLDYSVHEFVFKMYVDNQDAVDLLSELGLPAELIEISFESSTVGAMQHEMLIISDGQGVTLLNMTLLSETTATGTVPAAPKRDITDIKMGWVFGEEGKLKALRFKIDLAHNGGNVYPLAEGIIGVSSTSPFYPALGSAKYDIAKTLEHYFGSQGKQMVVWNGGESQFINP